MPDDAALRSRRSRRHLCGDHSLCRHDPASTGTGWPSYDAEAAALHGFRRWQRKNQPLHGKNHGRCSRCGGGMAVGKATLPPDRRMCQKCRAEVRLDDGGPRPCELCEVIFTPRYAPRSGTMQRWCSKSCAQAWRNGARPPYVRPEHDAGTSRASRKRRRLVQRAETWDGVKDAQILERDRWRCGICGKRIGKSYKYPHPRSKSIDHIVPLSEGGDDTAANKRAAHLACNCGRMNRGGGEQLAMIG